MVDAAEVPAPAPVAAAPSASPPAAAESAAATLVPHKEAPAAAASVLAEVEREYTTEELAADTARLKAQLAAMADTINSLSLGSPAKAEEKPAALAMPTAPAPAAPAAAPAAPAAAPDAQKPVAPAPAVAAAPPATPPPAAPKPPPAAPTATTAAAAPAAAAAKPNSAPAPAALPVPPPAAAAPAPKAPPAVPAAPSSSAPSMTPVATAAAAKSPSSPASPSSGGWNAWAEAMTGARSPLSQTLPVSDTAVRTVASALQALDGAVSMHAPSWMTKREEADEVTASAKVPAKAPAPSPSPSPAGAAEVKELAPPPEGEDVLESCSSMLLNPGAGASLIDLARVRTLLSQQAADVLTAAGYGTTAGSDGCVAAAAVEAPPAAAGDPLRYLSGNASGGVVSWRADQEAGERLVATCGAASPVRCLLALPDGLFATGSADGVVRLWRVADGKCLREMLGHKGAVRGLAAAQSPGAPAEGCIAAGLVLLSASEDGGLRLWPLAASAEGASAVLGTEADWHTAAVTAVAALGDGLVASGSRDASLRIWRLASPLSGACARVLRGHGDAVYAVCHLGGTRCASGGEDGTARVWDAATGACLREFRHPSGVHALAQLSNGARDLLVTGCADAVVRVWDAFGGEMDTELHGHADAVIALAVPRSAVGGGAKIVSAAKDGTLCVWAWEGPGAQAGTRERALRALPHEAVISIAPLY